MPEGNGTKKPEKKVVIAVKPELHRELKTKAASAGIPLQQFVERGIRRYLGIPQFKRQSARRKAA